MTEGSATARPFEKQFRQNKALRARTVKSRRSSVKQAKQAGEESRVGIRAHRHKIMDFIKKKVKDGFSEDAGKRKEDEVQKSIESYMVKIDKMIEVKEKDIMTV